MGENMGPLWMALDRILHLEGWVWVSERLYQMIFMYQVSVVGEVVVIPLPPTKDV